MELAVNSHTILLKHEQCKDPTLMHAMRQTYAIWLAALALICAPMVAAAADRAKLEAFLEVTGFDVALESIRLSAGSAPEMLGFQAEDFGSEWTRLTGDVFATDKMHGMALDILEKTLDDDMLSHAADFYATDLGKRLVVAENKSHMSEQEELVAESGEAIVEGLAALDSPRLEYLRRMNVASDTAGVSVRAIQEIQVRFLMAAAGAGIIELELDEAGLRALLGRDEDALKADLAHGALTGAAYTYQAFSDDEVLAYAEALEHPKMREVYDLMNAVQYEIMANRFEALARAMEGMQPSQDL